MEEEIEENQIWVEKGRMKKLIFGGISWCRRKRNLGFFNSQLIQFKMIVKETAVFEEEGGEEEREKETE